MGYFVTTLDARMLRGSDDGEGVKWILQSPLVYQSDTLGTVIVPVGFVTNFVSMRRIPLMYSLFANLAQEPATLHDYLYSPQGRLPNGKQYTRADADESFRRTWQERLMINHLSWRSGQGLRRCLNLGLCGQLCAYLADPTGSGISEIITHYR